MKRTPLILALALLGAVAPAFADTAEDTYWDMYNSVYVTGDIFALGIIDVSSSSSALVDQVQETVGNLSVGDGDNTASASDDAASGAEGNIGINIAAGVGNAQANDTALSAVDGDEVHASAQVFSSQLTFFNGGTDDGDPDNQLFYDASVGDSVLSDASGNIGLNVAAGVGNAQGNALAASVNSSGTLATASSQSDQATVFNTLLAELDLDNTASLSGSALSGAVGNIGVNIAAGVGNAQHNGLSIAVASCGTCTPPPPPPPCGGCGGD